MLKDQKSTPVTINGITISEHLLRTLDSVKEYGLKGSLEFTRNCLIIASLDLYAIGLDREFFQQLTDFAAIQEEILLNNPE